MKFEYKTVQSNDADFARLASELSKSLMQITNDSGESSFSSDVSDSDTDVFIVVYVADEPVACGALRYHSDDTCELKRMYSKHPGAGGFLIRQLEMYAISKGYKRAILSTRRVNERAVGFYKHQSYSEIGAYGRYIGLNRSICLGKSLIP